MANGTYEQAHEGKIHVVNCKSWIYTVQYASFSESVHLCFTCSSVKSGKVMQQKIA